MSATSTTSNQLAKLRDIASRLRVRLLELKNGVNLPSSVTDVVYRLAGERLVERAVNVGDSLPDAELVAPDGKTRLRLAALAKTRPVVLVFFRGSWCPWCSTMMEYLTEATELLRGLGAEIVAVSPMTDAATRTLVAERNLPFPVFGGASGKALIKQFGLGFNPLPDYEGLFQHLGVDLKATYGEDADVMIPIPASYVINMQAQLIYAFLEEDFRVRGGVDEIAATIIRLQRDRAYVTSVCLARWPHVAHSAPSPAVSLSFFLYSQEVPLQGSCQRGQAAHVHLQGNLRQEENQLVAVAAAGEEGPRALREQVLLGLRQLVAHVPGPRQALLRCLRALPRE